VAELRRWAGWAVAAVASVVMVVGLLPGNPAPVDDAARATALAANLRCPFCQGESIAEAPSQVARDLEAFIVEKVEEGWTDEEIYAFFQARYGERVRLDPPLAGWGAALWLSPLALFGVGIAAIVSRRRARPGPPTERSSPLPKVEAPKVEAS
jgi:cytochrome c-type biogenesis protein CcmH